MQNDEIKFKIEEIEKRLSRTYKTGDTNNKEIEKRVDFLEMVKTSTDIQISTIVANINSLKSVDDLHQTHFEDLDARLKIVENGGSNGNNAQVEQNKLDIENLTEEVDVLKSKDNEILEEISDIKTKNDEFSDKFNEINNIIDTIGGATSNDLPETYNFFNTETFESGVQFYGLQQNYFTCFFLSDPSSICKIKVSAEIEILHDTETSVTLNSILNDEIINTQSYTVIGTENHSFEFEHTFYPTQINNNLVFKSTATNSINKTSRVVLKNYKIEILGRNVTILNKDLSFKVFICKDKYYLTKNEQEKGYGKIMTIGANDWNENFAQLPRLNLDITDASATSQDKSTYNNFCYTFFPYATLNASTNKYTISSTDNGLAATLSGNRYTYITQQSLVPLKFSALPQIALHDMYMLSTPGEGDTEIKNACFVRYNSNYTLGMNNVKKGSITSMHVKLNGETPPNKWVFSVPVMFKDWEDNPNNSYCFVALDEFGHNYFFPSKNANYTVDLGLGAQTSAFKQTDGTINVYTSIANKIFKKVLTFNSETSQYELTSSEFFKDGNEFIEGYLDDYFIKKGRTWSYVPPTTI